MSLVAPIVHIGGTPKDHLIEAYCAALSALAKARKALAATGPNMRDYYVQNGGTGNFRIAMDAHQRRVRDLDAIIREISDLGEAVSDQ